MHGESFLQDQASRLREWVRRHNSTRGGDRPRRPALIAVLGGNPGVGATTVALNLASALSASGLRTVLLDGDWGGADATKVCPTIPKETLAEVFTAGRTLADVLQPGPDGMYIIPGIGPGQKLLSDPRYSSQRVLDGLRTLGSWAEMVVTDLGSQLSAWSRTIWQAAHCRLIITTPEPNILMSTYAVLKLLSASLGLTSVHLVVNQAASEQQTQELYGRLAHTCLRFLNLPVSLAGFLPVDPTLASLEKTPSIDRGWRLGKNSRRLLMQLAHYVCKLLDQQIPPPENSAPPGGSKQTEADLSLRPADARVRSETSGLPTLAGPPQWRVQPGDWVGKVGFPVTISPSLDTPAAENKKKG